MTPAGNVILCNCAHVQPGQRSYAMAIPLHRKAIRGAYEIERVHVHVLEECEPFATAPKDTSHRSRQNSKTYFAKKTRRSTSKSRTASTRATWHPSQATQNAPRPPRWAHANRTRKLQSSR